MSKKQLSEEYKNMMGAASKMAFITAVRRNHAATLDDIAEMSKSEKLGSLTVGEVFYDEVDFGVQAQALPASSSEPGKRKRKKQSVASGAADTRSAANRASYDEELLDAVSSKRWMSAQDLRKVAGGTPLQARKALNRLIEGEKIKFRGKARATKYRLRKKGKKDKNKTQAAA